MARKRVNPLEEVAQTSVKNHSGKKSKIDVIETISKTIQSLPVNVQSSLAHLRTVRTILFEVNETCILQAFECALARSSPVLLESNLNNRSSVLELALSALCDNTLGFHSEHPKSFCNLKQKLAKIIVEYILSTETCINYLDVSLNSVFLAIPLDPVISAPLIDWLQSPEGRSIKIPTNNSCKFLSLLRQKKIEHSNRNIVENFRSNIINTYDWESFHPLLVETLKFMRESDEDRSRIWTLLQENFKIDHLKYSNRILATQPLSFRKIKRIILKNFAGLKSISNDPSDWCLFIQLISCSKNFDDFFVEKNFYQNFNKIMDTDVNSISFRISSLLTAIASHDRNTFMTIIDSNPSLLRLSAKHIFSINDISSREFVDKMVQSMARGHFNWRLIEGIPPSVLYPYRASFMTVLDVLDHLDSFKVDFGFGNLPKLFKLVQALALESLNNWGDGSIWASLSILGRKLVASTNSATRCQGIAFILALLNHVQSFCHTDIKNPSVADDIPSCSQYTGKQSISFESSPQGQLLITLFDSQFNSSNFDSHSTNLLCRALIVGEDSIFPLQPGFDERIPKCKSSEKNCLKPSTAESNISSITSEVLIWINTRISNIFERFFVKECSHLHKTGDDSELAFAIDEPAIYLSLLPSVPFSASLPWILALLSRTESEIHQGRVDNIDALLGCPFLVPTSVAVYDLNGLNCEKNEARQSNSWEKDVDSIQLVLSTFATLIDAFWREEESSEKCISRLRMFSVLPNLCSTVKSVSKGLGMACSMAGVSSTLKNTLDSLDTSTGVKMKNITTSHNQNGSPTEFMMRSLILIDPKILLYFREYDAQVIDSIIEKQPSLARWSDEQMVKFCTLHGGDMSLKIYERFIDELRRRNNPNVRLLALQLLNSRTVLNEEACLIMKILGNECTEEVVSKALDYIISREDGEDASIKLAFEFAPASLLQTSLYSTLMNVESPCSANLKQRVLVFEAILHGLTSRFLSSIADLESIARLFECAVKDVRNNDLCAQALHETLFRHGKILIDNSLFGKTGILILTKTFKTNKNQVIEILRVIQKSTRILQIMCDHYKINKGHQSRSMGVLIPGMRRALERVPLHVKQILQANECLSAFWMGNLKHRSLDGNEISSSKVLVVEDLDNDDNSVMHDS